MQVLQVNKALSTANALEQLTDQVGGTYHVNTLVCRVERATGSVLMVTLVTHGSPGETQEWVMLNGSESCASQFTTQGDQLLPTNEQPGMASVEAYAARLLAEGTWYGAAAPYYPE